MKTLPFKSLQPTAYKSLGMRPAKKLVVYSNPCHDEQGRFCSTGGGGGGVNFRDKDSWIKAVLEHPKAGLVSDVREAGYVLEDGRMIGTPGQKAMFHHNLIVKEVLSEEQRNELKEISHRDDAFNSFVKITGAVKIYVGSNETYISLANAPTTRQWNAIRQAMDHTNGNIVVDIFRQNLEKHPPKSVTGKEINAGRLRRLLEEKGLQFNFATYTLSTPGQKKTRPKPGAKPRLVKINGLLAHQASSRVDPTRTTGLRNRWAAEMGRRFTALRRLVWKAIMDDDCFGIGPAYKMYRPTTLTVHVKFDFPRLEDKIPAFMVWLQQQQDEGILELVSLPRMGQSLGEPWTNLFVRDSYERGVIRAREQLMSAGYGAPGLGAGDLPLMGLPGMASGILANPFHVDRLASVFLRSYDGLKGISAAMSMQVSHVLAQGLADGDNPITLAKKMNYVISGMGKDLGITDSLGRFIPAERRAKMLARTEVIHSHALATLQEAKIWGVAGVTAEVEFVNAGFNVCPICKSLQGKVYTIEEAMNIIPVHVHCRCAWIIKPREYGHQ